MNKFKENWRDFNPPMVPIYFIDINALKHMLSSNPKAINIDVLWMMLGYFEEYEHYEKAEVVNKAILALGVPTPAKEAKVIPLRKVPDFLPPDDGNEWVPSEDGKYWQRMVSKEDLLKYLKGQNEFTDDDLEPA